MLEKEKTISNYLTNHQVISIIGMSKNAGKTTVLNRIIYEQQTTNIAITSIGLDGEKIDNVNQKPKPRIMVYPGMLIATSIDCLTECEIDYIIHEKTGIDTALGEVVIIEATSQGNVLVAGPSTKSEMKRLVHHLQKYNPKHIFLDGALYRKSFSVQDVVDGMILVTGAIYSNDILTTVEDTKILVDQLSIKEHEGYRYDCVFHDGTGIDFENKHHKIENIDHVISFNKPVQYMYVHGAFTNNIAEHILNHKELFQEAIIQVDDTVSFICDMKYYRFLQKLNIQFFVTAHVPLLFIGVNPYSPVGTSYDNEEFKKQLQANTVVPCINVLTDME